MTNNNFIQVHTKKHWLWWRVFKFGLWLIRFVMLRGIMKMQIENGEWRSVALDFEWKFTGDESIRPEHE